MDEKRFNARLPYALWHALRMEAARRDVSVTRLIVVLLSQALGLKVPEEEAKRPAEE